jgi:methylenetetrahydrofolate dehydrogenase (NADP+)/methenyltetrahydrofolate cyclohydrolase
VLDVLDTREAEAHPPAGAGRADAVSRADPAVLIDGKAIAATLRRRLAEQVARLDIERGVTPTLAVVLVGDDPASQIYVRQKIRAAEEIGIKWVRHLLPASAVTDDLLALVRRLNADDMIDGILVQLPLPPPVDARAVLSAIDPDKDVDGLHAVNVGRLAAGLPGLVPCTARGCEILIRSVRPRPAGGHAVIIGRSQLIGRPLAQLLLRADCTVTVAHSKSSDLAALCRGAEILVAAAGRAELVRGDWVRPGAVVIDAGINRVIAADETSKLVGDVAFAEAAERAAAITPVPGGVGPMTVACLLENTVLAACRRRCIDPTPL